MSQAPSLRVVSGPPRPLVASLLAFSMIAATSRPAQAAAPNPARSVFVHLFEWRWADVARECEVFLGPRGFAAVQISPPNEHARKAGNPWWERYQPVSYNLVSRSGNQADFEDMVRRCRAAGVEIYADVVINHMATGSGTSIAGLPYGVRDFPGTYGPQDFHWNAPPPQGCQASISDYNNRHSVQDCELAGLPDLRTEMPDVRSRIAGYLVDLYRAGVRGYRVDAAKHIWAGDLSAILGLLNASRGPGPAPFVVQEVIDPGTEVVKKSEYYATGDVNEFLYGQRLGEKFRNQGGNISQLRTLGESWGLAPTGEAVVFVDNHDKQRGHAGGGAYITHQDGVLYDLANVFMLGWPYGYPQLMSSYAFTNGDQGPPSDAAGNTRPIYSSPSSTTPDCFGDWKCEHRWRPIANMVTFRNTVGSTAVTNWWDDAGDRIAFGRGDRGFVVINRGSTTLSRTFQTALPAGVYCDVIAGDFAGGACSGRTLTVSSTGQAAISVPPMFAAALHVGARLGGTPSPSPSPSPAPSPSPSPGGAVTVAFAVNATTWFGQNVYVVGNLPQLGSWNPDAAIPLSAATYPVWRANVSLPASAAVEYKYIKKPGDGGAAVQWETGSNRTFTAPASGTVTRNDTWR